MIHHSETHIIKKHCDETKHRSQWPYEARTQENHEEAHKGTKVAIRQQVTVDVLRRHICCSYFLFVSSVFFRALVCDKISCHVEAIFRDGGPIFRFSCLLSSTPSSYKKCYSKRKEYAPKRSDFFPFRVDSFSKGSKQLCKNFRDRSVCIPLGGKYTSNNNNNDNNNNKLKNKVYQAELFFWGGGWGRGIVKIS